METFLQEFKFTTFLLVGNESGIRIQTAVVRDLVWEERKELVLET